jgi:hypothetical protein
MDALEAARVEYALGGALAAAAWGEARSTQAVDLVANLPVEQIQTLSSELARREILYKLRYFSLSQQQKHTRDVVAILYAQKGKLDEAYLAGWVQRLGLEAIWRYMLDELQR